MYFQENVENNVCDLRFRPELSVILKKTLNSYLKTRYIVLKILIDWKLSKRLQRACLCAYFLKCKIGCLQCKIQGCKKKPVGKGA